jgi:hypothetical protein
MKELTTRRVPVSSLRVGDRLAPLLLGTEEVGLSGPIATIEEIEPVLPPMFYGARLSYEDGTEELGLLTGECLVVTED